MRSDAEAAVDTLRRCETIRARCGAITAAVAAGDSPHFRLDRARLDEVAERVAALTRHRFPDLKIPYHSRWRHFEAGGVDRKAALDAKLAGRGAASVARARIDLALISVLLDAGAGPDWQYVESAGPPPPHASTQGEAARAAGAESDGGGTASNRSYGRSEGLAVASFHAFMAGLFSSDPGDPCRVDAKALLAIDATTLARAFQVTARNPLVGLEGRAALLRALGAALREQPQTFTAEGQPGRLFDALTHHHALPAPAHHGVAPAPHHGLPAHRHQVPAASILRLLLDHFSSIWPSGQRLAGLPVGDAWPHPRAGGSGLDAGWVPFHKLSQWLSYSLLEPFEWAGVKVTGLDSLTGLPEYRNGGLLLDAGVLEPRDPAAFAARRWTPADEAIVEWRALTVSLLDELAPKVRERLGVPADSLPLACILEGGTWAAGRQIAAERRPGGPPPVTIESDGTVF